MRPAGPVPGGFLSCSAGDFDGRDQCLATDPCAAYSIPNRVRTGNRLRQRVLFVRLRRRYGLVIVAKEVIIPKVNLLGGQQLLNLRLHHVRVHADQRQRQPRGARQRNESRLFHIAQHTHPLRRVDVLQRRHLD